MTETERLERELQQSEKMAAIGQLAAGIAHEINNPLATISTCLEGIRDRVEIQKREIEEKTPWVNDYLQRINQSVYRCKSIIDKLLIFSRPSRNVKQKFDLNKIIDDTISVVSLRAKKEKKKIRTNLSSRPIFVFGDPNQLGQVFLNILINGLDAIQEGGNILIETGADDNLAVVKITDDGIGIGSDDLPRIFEPFFTTKPPNKGTGLGLSISQQIIEEHGGAIHIQSKKGEGTVVEIRLPIIGGRI